MQRFILFLCTRLSVKYISVFWRIVVNESQSINIINLDIFKDKTITQINYNKIDISLANLARNDR